MLVSTIIIIVAVQYSMRRDRSMEGNAVLEDPESIGQTVNGILKSRL